MFFLYQGAFFRFQPLVFCTVYPSLRHLKVISPLAKSHCKLSQPSGAFSPWRRPPGENGFFPPVGWPLLKKTTTFGGVQFFWLPIFRFRKKHASFKAAENGNPQKPVVGISRFQVSTTETEGLGLRFPPPTNILRFQDF